MHLYIYHAGVLLQNRLQLSFRRFGHIWRLLVLLVIYCSVLQCVAVCCSVLQYVAVCCIYIYTYIYIYVYYAGSAGFYVATCNFIGFSRVVYVSSLRATRCYTMQHTSTCLSLLFNIFIDTIFLYDCGVY